MIAIFNQFKTPWIIKNSSNPDVFMFSKMKRFTDDNNEDKKAFLRVNLAASVVDADKGIDQRIESMTQMKDIGVLLDNNVTVSFDPKTYDPTIYINKKKDAPIKNILLLSMFIKDCRVLEVTTTDVFVLETLKKDEFFGLAASFNSDKANLNFTTYNPKTRVLETHVFNVVAGNFNYDKVVTRDTEPDSLRDFTPRKFKPARMTKAVLVTKEDESLLEDLKVYKDDKSSFDKFIIDLSKPNEVLPTMKENGYKAVTLFMPSNLTLEQTEKYDLFIRDAKRYFRVFFVIKNDGKIIKVKAS